ncbi:pantoate--beta-alanine ligase [Mesoterricola silvestris]|uniref:Pantothenate synthetase n=1 Tax=Mesoterricola silvestris TaxID=2927979 RepID=A0AA48H2J4_9BACT|nr:pantoate--beta-alanine ligase [Mesoterricola silvestris]BDU74833.1 pantothenate synthetase 1 [Mesoterricola silvestris]
MRIIRTISELKVALKALRESHKSIGFVPTMGYLHEGHASLIKQSTARCDATVVSVFVNPTQFGPGEDLSRYPRDLERDQNLCLRLGVAILFMPEAAEVYPTGFCTSISVGPIADALCGAFRPGHFRGVATVVAKLFSMVQPDLAFFGQKDLQQTAIIRRVVKDLNLPVDILVAPTVREGDGLALSSRNAYLTEAERARALGISRGLFAATAAFEKGERDAEALAALARASMEAAGEVQYCQVVDPSSLDPIVGGINRPAALCAAVVVGGTRLIDNVLLTPSGEPMQFISHLEA